MIICTSICTNYFPKALVMAKTAKKYMPEAKLVACLVEREIPAIAREQNYFDEVILAKDLGFRDFDRFIFKHSIVEASTSVKAQLFSYLLDRYNDEDIFIYLDPDIEVYGPFDELMDVLRGHSVVLTPHMCEPEELLYAITDNELWALRHGAYNLGFLAIRRAENSIGLINWWNSRLDKYCFDDVKLGVFTDQRWMDLAPCFFDVYIFKHAGYNYAPWNLSRRKLTVQNGKYLVNNVPLRFCHFSGFDSGANDYMFQKYVPDLSDPAYTLKALYTKQLDEMGQQTVGKTPWTYDFFTSGEKIANEAREVYRREPWRADKADSPFQLSNSDFINKGANK